MIKNYLKTAFRHARKYKGYTVLNLLGLVVGIVSSMLIFLWVQDEVQKDKFHAKSDHIYMLWRNMYQASGEINTTPAIPQPMVAVLENDYPEIEHVSLIGWPIEFLFRRDIQTSYETGRYVSPEFLEIFSFKLLAGNPNTALDKIHNIVITERVAEKYFGLDWKGKALGETFNIDERQEFVVSGVIENPGERSSAKFDWLINAEEYITRNDWVESWFNGGFGIMISTKPSADISALREKLRHEVNENTDYAADERIYLQKFIDTYLYSQFENGVPVGGRIAYVKIMTIIAVFILIIACINFMNLATARSTRRTKEIGVRKVLGAFRSALSKQFYVESFIMAVLATMIATGIVYLLLPYFNYISSKQLFINWGDPYVWTGLAGITLITGLLSGSYPALMLSSFKVVNSLKGIVKRSATAVFFRNGLVVFQFALSILLIIGTFVVSGQMDYVLNKNLGLDKENVIYTVLEGSLKEKLEVY
ncbi:MAG: ABC transporter permease, partial [Fulvivirga sp.]|nr:ABC transporter permease [Fulvivirga sp.]